jgi:hypothetical protein
MATTLMSRVAGVIAGMSLLLGGLVVSGGPAAAVPPTDRPAPLCGSPRVNGPVCYFWGLGYSGAQAGFTGNKSDLLNDGPSHLMWYFNHPGQRGDGQYIANNVASVHNRNLTCDVEVFSYPDSAGRVVTQTIRKGDSIPQLKDGLMNRNRGHRFLNCG